jgi:hypothetical protein
MQAGQEEVQSAEAVLLQILSKSKDFGEIGNPATDFLPRPNPAENQIKPKNLQRLLIPRGLLRFVVR